MKIRLLTIILIMVAAAADCRADDTRTGCLNERVKSLQMQVEGNPYAPHVLMLNTGERLIVTFDHLAEEREYLRYRLVHCDADWRPSQIAEVEYVDGFNLVDIEDYDYSRGTSTHYVHYELAVPSEDAYPKISGNYLLQVFPENDPDDVWLQCRFMVSEQTAGISSAVTSRTDIDYNKEHQQLELTIDVEGSNVQDPFNDLIVRIQQNGRTDNEARITHPLRLQNRNVAVYEHLSPLIFPAGNEYRRFETVSTYYPSMGVERIAYADPYYHFVLEADAPRNEDMYLYDQTQHGRYVVRQLNSDYSDTEADYGVVHFTLEMPEQKSGAIFIDGDFTLRRFEPESMLTYNQSRGCYERAMLLKQGAYNYQYLYVPAGSDSGLTAPIEGDKYPTVNEYLIKVYERKPGARYDRLIGVSQIVTQ